MNLQFKRLCDLGLTAEQIKQWINREDTNVLVARAINAIADEARSAQEIWENPTKAEWKEVMQTVEGYIVSGVHDISECSGFDFQEDPVFFWGDEEFKLFRKNLKNK